MNGNKYVIVKTYSTSFEANLALAKLRNSGIKAFIENNESILINPNVLVNGNIKIIVNEGDAQDALNILSEEAVS